MRASQPHSPSCTSRRSRPAVPGVHCWLNRAEIKSKKASTTWKGPPYLPRTINHSSAISTEHHGNCLLGPSRLVLVDFVTEVALYLLKVVVHVRGYGRHASQTAWTAAPRHDNAAATPTCDWLRRHLPPYSSDLAPRDFHVFEPLKKHLPDKRNATDVDVKQAVTSLLYSFGTQFILCGREVLVPR